MLLQEGFRKIGIEDYENYYYSRKVYQAYRTMLTGSLVDTLIVLKEQKKYKSGSTSPKTLYAETESAETDCQNPDAEGKLDIKTEQLKIKGTNGIPYLQKLGFLKSRHGCPQIKRKEGEYVICHHTGL